MPFLNRSNLHAYQERAVEFIRATPKCALFLDMGLGKTVSTLTAITDLLDACDAAKVLVIAPLRVANTVWKQEAARWAHLRHLRVKICTGTEKARISALCASADVYVINRENVPWLVEYYGKKWPFDLVAIDESSSFKSNSSARWKALKRTMPATDRMIQLTGTPAPNGLLDLWPQIYLLDAGERLGRSMTAYKSRWFESDYMGYSYTLRKGADDQIHAAVSDVVLTMRASDYLDMPDRVDSTVTVELPAKAMREYRTMESDLIAEFDGAEVTAMSAAALANKLLQLSNGACYTDDAGNWVETHTAKLDALADILEENPTENLLVAYNYKTDLLRLQARFPVAVVMDKEGEAVERWNNGEIRMLLAHPASSGHGLNLQRGGSVIVWFGLNWSLELYQQFNGRLHRQGQQKPVRVIHLVAGGCIDERVLAVLGDKEATQDKLINALRLTM